jgi:hypothetical protein
MFNLILLLSATQVISNPGGSPPAVSKEEVMAIFSSLPAVETGKVGDKWPAGVQHWEKRKDAAKIADAISLSAESREWATIAAVYAVYEGNLVTTVEGDGGKAFGTFQLHNTPRYIAFDPYRAVRIWFKRAKENEQLCEKNRPEERLAALASGSCSRGHVLVRRREALATAALEALDAFEVAADEAAEAEMVRAERADRAVVAPLPKE